MTTAGTATNTGSNRHRSSNGAATAAASAASTVHRSKSGKGMATVPSPTSPSTSPPSSSSSLSRHYQQQQPRSSTTSSNNNNQPLPTIQLSPGGFTPTVTTSATITTMTSNMALLPTDHPTSGSSRCSSSQSNVTNIAHKPSTGNSRHEPVDDLVETFQRDFWQQWEFFAKKTPNLLLKYDPPCKKITRFCRHCPSVFLRKEKGEIMEKRNKGRNRYRQ